MLIHKNFIVTAGMVLALMVVVAILYFQPFANKLSDSSLLIPDSSIPLIEVITDKTTRPFTYLHLCVWNPLEALWYRDEVPIGIIQGGPVNVFWNGTNRIFVVPDNPRGSFKILETNPLFQIHSIPFEDNMNPVFVADQSDRDEILIIREQLNTSNFRLDFQEKNKQTTSFAFAYPLSKTDHIRLIPIDATWSDQECNLFFCFQHQRSGNISHGVLQYRIDLSQKTPPAWTKLIESFYPDSSIRYAWTSTTIYRIHSNLQISSAKSKDQGFLPFNTAQGSLNSFQEILFDQNAQKLELALKGIELREKTRILPTMSAYRKYLLVSWSPEAGVVSSSKASTVAGNLFQAQQVTAILHNLPIGRIEHLDQHLRIFRENTLRHEIQLRENGFSSYFLLP